MTRARGFDFALLLLAAASLLFGGGFGCTPDLDGVKLKVDAFDGVPYMGINGKKPPGEGSLRFPYNLMPPFYGKINVGIMNPDLLQQSQDAVGYGQLEREDQAETYRIEARYELTPSIGLRFTTNVDANDFFCPGVAQGFLRIDDDGDDATLQAKCARTDPWSIVTATASQFDVGEKWYFRVGAFDLQKKAQIGFNHYRVFGDTSASATPERGATNGTFELFHFGLRAFDRLLDGNLTEALSFGNQALSGLSTARGLTDPEFGIADFGDTKVPKDLVKIDKGFFKIYQGKFEGKEQSYVKKWPKLADRIACALDDMDDFDD